MSDMSTCLQGMSASAEARGEMRGDEPRGTAVMGGSRQAMCHPLSHESHCNIFGSSCVPPAHQHLPRLLPNNKESEVQLTSSPIASQTSHLLQFSHVHAYANTRLTIPQSLQSKHVGWPALPHSQQLTNSSLRPTVLLSTVPPQNAHCVSAGWRGRRMVPAGPTRRSAGGARTNARSSAAAPVEGPAGTGPENAARMGDCEATVVGWVSPSARGGEDEGRRVCRREDEMAGACTLSPPSGDETSMGSMAASVDWECTALMTESRREGARGEEDVTWLSSNEGWAWSCAAHLLTDWVQVGVGEE
jgi:hypothetical protein